MAGAPRSGLGPTFGHCPAHEHRLALRRKACMQASSSSPKGLKAVRAQSHGVRRMRQLQAVRLHRRFVTGIGGSRLAVLAQAWQHTPAMAGQRLQQGRHGLRTWWTRMPPFWRTTRQEVGLHGWAFSERSCARASDQYAPRPWCAYKPASRWRFNSTVLS